MKKLIKILMLLLLIFLGYKCFQTYRTVKQVMTYQPMVREILAENDTSANEELILAMIYTETKGREVDVMQSSESASGSANTITDSKESIRQGIVYLTEKLRLAEEKGVGVWT
ncbi:lysozyme family protein, partial [Streptococcus ruminantium]